MRVLSLLAQSARPPQWTKNFLVFAGLVFARKVFEAPLLVAAVLAFGAFCLVSSATYLFNDLADLAEDRQHPRKRLRPLASGALGKGAVVGALIALLAAGLGVSWVVGRGFFLVALAYTALHVAYTLFLKHVVILDVFAVAFGFVLRVVGGAEAIHVGMSSWLIACTILLSLFLALCKRRHELVLMKEDARRHRRVLGEYNPYLLDQMIAVVTAATVMAYILYTMSDETVAKFHTRNLIYTVPFVLYGIFRYLYLVHHKGQGGSPEDALLADPALLADIVLWAMAVGFIIYR